MTERLGRPYYTRDVLEVAPSLLGKQLVRVWPDGSQSRYVISETEAYRGEEDLACHARAGRTPRTEVMYGPPGHAYVYFTYGMHWLLNFVTEREGYPAAVLIRALLPTDGLEIIAERRGGQPSKRWTDGPGKICQALAIDGVQNGMDICTQKSEILVEDDLIIPKFSVTTGPRVGLNTVPEPWKSIPWRFQVRDLTIDD